MMAAFTSPDHFVTVINHFYNGNKALNCEQSRTFGALPYTEDRIYSREPCCAVTLM
ncbi:Uncharacterised protein [Raoultella terrigena]|uniref:Uncharacterized protein n=1 Tax=Raoultella terrigena TaxID=577 RepID=A0A3P8LZI3_RAOTE|nr:Uncharacterised protein [Raoultella terrigena]